MDRHLPIAAVALLAMTVPASADLLWGANGHPFSAYPGTSYERQIDYLKDLGMKSYRVDVASADSVPALARLVSAAKGSGVEILPVITPHFDLDKEGAGALREKARQLAFALGSRFRSDIRVWELGNEMENYAIIQPCEMRDNGVQYPCEWGPAGGVDVLDYYGPRWAKVGAVLKGLSEGMTEADPTIRKAMGTAGWGHIGAFERMRQDGIEWDITVWHSYGQDPEWAFKQIARYGQPIWVTEFNNPLGSQPGDQAQADGLIKAMKQLRDLQARYNVEAAHIYELMDETYWAPDFEAYMGLVRLNGSQADGWVPGEPKPAYFAAREHIRGPVTLPRPGRSCDLAAVQAVQPRSAREASFGYCLVLGSYGPAGDVRRWAEKLKAGEFTFVGMLMNMLTSEEFGTRYADFSMTDREYVEFLYQMMLGRPADGQGLESYASQLRGGSTTRRNVAVGIITSAEFAQKHAAILNAGSRVVDAVPPG